MYEPTPHTYWRQQSVRAVVMRGDTDAEAAGPGVIVPRPWAVVVSRIETSGSLILKLNYIEIYIMSCILFY
jgi:hypothetical protein